MSDPQRKSKIQLKEVRDDEDIAAVEKLAEEIWTQHYTPIIGSDQVRYMLDTFQSFDAIDNQISQGMEYFLLNYDQEPVGYMACKVEGEDMFLSKIYVLSRMRGQGIGGYALDFLSTRARKQGCRHLSLTVNKNNTHSIRAYERLGFVNQGPLQTDIGRGFIMDDYMMKKAL